MTSRKQPESKPSPRPWVSITITAVLLGLAIQDQLKSGSIDPGLLGALVILALFWAGQAVDNFFPLR